MADYAKGQLLRELRKSSGLSREKVAGEVGVTTKTLYTWENDGGIKLDNAIKLAAFYGVEDASTLMARDTDGGDLLEAIDAKLTLVTRALAALGNGLADIPRKDADAEAFDPTPDELASHLEAIGDSMLVALGVTAEAAPAAAALRRESAAPVLSTVPRPDDAQR